MPNHHLAEKVAAILRAAPDFVTNESAGFFNELSTSLDDLMIFGFDAEDIRSIEAVEQFEAPLAFAKFVEEAHLAMLKTAVPYADIWGTTFEIAMGNLVVALCTENGVDVLDDGGYCLKATAEEICEYNLQRLAA